MKKTTLSILLLFISLNLYAQEVSMRSCMLLPITDNAGDSLGYKVFERLESYLKGAAWCEYSSNAQLIDVFSKYRGSLKDYLEDEKVIQTIAKKMTVGSIIKVDLKYEVNSVLIRFEVIGSNGTDIYSVEEKEIKTESSDEISRQIIHWLDLYESQIPYDGKVLGVLGDQVTFSFHGAKKVGIGQKFRIKRLKKKKKHPLLKKIVDWEAEVIAKGEIFNVNKKQALGDIKVYKGQDKAGPGDWIELEKYSHEEKSKSNSLTAAAENQFGKLGFLTLFLTGSSSNVGSNTLDNNKMTGLTFGFSAETEVWITRNYFFVSKFSRRLGSLTKQSGTVQLNKISIVNGELNIGGGYKHLPLGFFYGPQVDIKGGYKSYSYSLETADDDGFGQNAISGIYVGVLGELPLRKGLRVYGGGEFIPFPEFSDNDNIFGTVKSASSMMFEAGAKYQYNPLISLDGAVEVISNSAKFKGTKSQLSYQETIFKFGASFIF